jgi:hypothetical protein
MGSGMGAPHLGLGMRDGGGKGGLGLTCALRNGHSEHAYGRRSECAARRWRASCEGKSKEAVQSGQQCAAAEA